jgi:Flp pilus assembly protein CpaB
MNKNTDRFRKFGNDKGLTMPQVLLLALTCLVILFLGWRQFDRYYGSRTVVVATAPLQGGQVIAADDVKTQKMPRREVPEDAILKLEEVVGQTIRNTVEEGGVLAISDFLVETLPVEFANMIPEGRVLYTLNLTSLTIPLSGLRMGDSLDVVIQGSSSEDERLTIANIIAQDVLLIGYTESPNSAVSSGADSGPLGLDLAQPPVEDEEKTTRVMLAVQPEDVVPLAEVDRSDGLALVLHRRQEQDEGEERLEVKNFRDRVQLIQGKESAIISIP